MSRDVEVCIVPTAHSRNSGFDLDIRTVVDGVPNSASWTKSDLTDANLRKIADTIYTHLGIELSYEAQDSTYLRSVEEGRDNGI